MKIPKLLRAATLVLLLVAFMPLKLLAATYSGSCGDNARWSLDTETGHLNITGTGAMRNYFSSSSRPWNSYCSTIKTVSVESGVTSIGEYAFYDCSSLTSITIPEGVTSIANYAFQGCSSLTSITIPESVTSIGHYAFNDCSSLTSITIPESVTSIGYDAFYGCSSLTSITIPESVTSIGSRAFEYCSFVESKFINKSSLSSIENNYWGAKVGDRELENGLLIKDNVVIGCRPWVTSVTIPEGVTSIGNYAFYKCSSLTSITIPEGVTSIGDYAFYGCSSLTSINIPEGVTSIGSSAFGGCTSLPVEGNLRYADTYLVGAADYSLTTYTIKQGTRFIGSSAFGYHSSLTSITIPEGVTSIGTYAFYYCSSLTSITIPEGVTSIGDGAFVGTRSLSDITCLATTPPSLTSTDIFSNYDATLHVLPGCKAAYEAADGWKNFANIVEDAAINPSGTCGDNARWTFNPETGHLSITGTGAMTDFGYSNQPWSGYRESIKTVSVAAGITSIGKYAFYDCSSLTSITIPESVTSIGTYAFYYCSSLTSITIPEGVTSIGDGAFRSCSSLTSITIPESVTSIGSSAFSSCSSLTSITIPESVTSIGQSTFYDCSSLTSITIPESVTSIGNYAFEYCSSLTSITIPESVTSIRDRAFSGCSSLTSITIPESVTRIGYDAFYGCSSLTSITIPESVTSIGIRAFGYCSFVESKFINNSSLSSIENNYWGANVGGQELENGLLIKDNVVICCRSWVTSVTIPESVVSIGNRAFYSCSSLTSITIPESVTSIGDEAFTGCSSLTSITIPESVTSIGSYAFQGCSSLTSITIPEGVTSIGDHAFQYCSSLTSITILGSVTSIGEYAFSDCSPLTSITIPEGVTSIGYCAFYNCGFLTSVNIPSSVTSIESGAFSETESLSDITCLATTPPSLSSRWTFDNYDATVHVLPGCGDAYRAADIWKDFANIVEDAAINPSGTCGDNARWTFNPETGHLSITGTGAMTDFGSYSSNPWNDYRESIKTVSIASGITSIGSGAFRRCSVLTSVTIPEGVTSIGNEAFAYTSLTSVTIPEGVTSIGNDAFSNCWFLTSITIPNTVTSIGERAFGACLSLTSITIPNSVTSIGSRAFGTCYFIASNFINNSSLNDPANWEATICDVEQDDGLLIKNNIVVSCRRRATDVVIPFGVTGIAERAFIEHPFLTSIAIPNSVTSIGEYAFDGCNSLTSITIPSSMTSIGEYAFYVCEFLTSVNILSSVTSIGTGAFGSTRSLSDITCLATTPPSLSARWTFDNYDATVHVLPGCGDAYRAADIWKDFANIVEDAGQIATDIARIEDVVYPSLAEAISAASTMKNPVIEMIGADPATDAVSLSNATLVFPEGTSYAGTITVNAGGVLDMQGGSISVSNNEAVHVNSGTLRMSAGSISTSMANKDALYVRNDGKAYISGGTLTGMRYAMMINGDTSRGGVVEVTGGQFVRLMTGANNNSHGSVIYNWDASYAPEGYMCLSYDANSATLALTEDYAALAEGKWAFESFPTAMSTNYKNITLTSTYVADANLDVRKNLTIGETGAYTGNMTVYNTYSLTIEGEVNGRVAGYSGSVININGGSVTANDNTSAVETRSVLNMTGGEITNLSDAANSAAIVIKQAATSVNIEDGVFTGVKGLATDATIGVSQFVHGGKFSNDVTKLTDVVEEGLVTTQQPVSDYYTLVKVSDAEAEDKTLTINFPVDAAIYNAILDQYPDRQFSYIDMSGDEAYTADDVVLKNPAHTNANTLFNIKNEAFADQTNVICNGSASQVSLTYGYPYVMPLQIDNVSSISYTRNYTVADWADLYLPFDIPAGSPEYRLAEIWDTEVAKTDGNGSAVSIEFVTLDDGDILSANTPAIIKPLEAGEKTIVVENTTLYPSESNSISCSTTKEEFEFRGVYDNTTLLDKKAWFFQASTQQFRFVSSPTAYLQSFRFYMTIADKSTHELLYGNEAPSMVKFQVFGDDATGINAVSGAETEQSDKTYNMSGQRVNTPRKGIYIVNGKKTFVNK